MRIAVVSDTHGLLRPVVAEALAGAPLVLHAGDVGTLDVLDALEAIAPTRAIRGNVDRGDWATALPTVDTVELAGHRIHLVHDRKDIAVDPVAERIDVVVSGHSHRARSELIDGVLWLNPGSIGPRRFRLPVTMAWLTLHAPGRPPDAEIVEFDIR